MDISLKTWLLSGLLKFPCLGEFWGIAMRILINCLTLLGLITHVMNADAHHSFAAEFSYELFGTKEGEVVEVHYVNPHTRVFIAVTNENGEEEIWDAQTHAVTTLLRAGWRRDTLKVGERITLQGNLGLDNSRKLLIRTMTLENGTVITPDS